MADKRTTTNHKCKEVLKYLKHLSLKTKPQLLALLQALLF